MDTKKKSFASWLKTQEANNPSEKTFEISPKLVKCARIELDKALQSPENIEPDRGDLDDPKIEWRSGKPNYSLANLAFVIGKSKCHARGSLEMIVENAVKTWEMEASHKVKTDQWETIVKEKYNVQANGEKVFGLEEASTRGNYNVMMDHCNPNLYDASKEDFDSSHHLFRNALHGSFPWEVLEVFTGPPNLVFSWRHWAEFTGEYEGNKGHGQLVEMEGFGCVNVTEKLKITQIRIFYKPESFLEALKGISVMPLKASVSPALGFLPFHAWMQTLKIRQGVPINNFFVRKAEDETARMLMMPEIMKPEREISHDQSILWRTGKPDYSFVDLAYLKGRMQFHLKESLEFLVEKLIKSCEMEISHKNDKRQWDTTSDEFKMEVNGKDASESIDDFVKGSSEIFNNPFPWEVTKVYSKAPELAFTWRHWIDLGMNKETEQQNISEIKGFAILKLNGSSKIVSIQLFCKPDYAVEEHINGINKCPFANAFKK